MLSSWSYHLKAPPALLVVLIMWLMWWRLFIMTTNRNRLMCVWGGWYVCWCECMTWLDSSYRWAGLWGIRYSAGATIDIIPLIMLNSCDIDQCYICSNIRCISQPLIFFITWHNLGYKSKNPNPIAVPPHAILLIIDTLFMGPSYDIWLT